MIGLRKLKEEDAPYMLEWMHDKDVTRDLSKDFSKMTIDDCLSFIQTSQNDSKNLHLAITDEKDVYLGTVSLKNIDYETKKAEFAITIRRMAMHTGISSLAMKKIIEIGFKEKGLNVVYWFVSKSNTRAIGFYDKNGYQRVGVNEIGLYKNGNENNDNYLWYSVHSKTFY